MQHGCYWSAYVCVRGSFARFMDPHNYFWLDPGSYYPWNEPRLRSSGADSQSQLKLLYVHPLDVAENTSISEIVLQKQLRTERQTSDRGPDQISTKRTARSSGLCVCATLFDVFSNYHSMIVTGTQLNHKTHHLSCSRMYGDGRISSL